MSDQPNATTADVKLQVSGVPTWFWVVSGIALLWNLMGLMMFVMDMTMSAETLAANYNEEELEVVKQIPAWVKGAYGLAVIFGVLGCVGLLMRKKWAFPVLILSLAGVLAQQSYFYFLSDMIAVMGASMLPLTITILVIAVLLVVFAKFSIGKGWLN